MMAKEDATQEDQSGVKPALGLRQNLRPPGIYLFYKRRA